MCMKSAITKRVKTEGMETRRYHSKEESLCRHPIIYNKHILYLWCVTSLGYFSVLTLKATELLWFHHGNSNIFVNTTFFSWWGETVKEWLFHWRKTNIFKLAERKQQWCGKLALLYKLKLEVKKWPEDMTRLTRKEYSCLKASQTKLPVKQAINWKLWSSQECCVTRTQLNAVRAFYGH